MADDVHMPRWTSRIQSSGAYIDPCRKAFEDAADHVLRVSAELNRRLA
ncbi:hypothetical protein ABZ894_08000 [Nocardia beijingensis]